MIMTLTLSGHEWKPAFKRIKSDCTQVSLLPNYKAYEAGRFMLDILEYTFKAHCVL